MWYIIGWKILLWLESKAAVGRGELREFSDGRGYWDATLTWEFSAAKGDTMSAMGKEGCGSFGVQLRYARVQRCSAVTQKMLEGKSHPPTLSLSWLLTAFIATMTAAATPWSKMTSLSSIPSLPAITNAPFCTSWHNNTKASWSCILLLENRKGWDDRGQKGRGLCPHNRSCFHPFQFCLSSSLKKKSLVSNSFSPHPQAQTKLTASYPGCWQTCPEQGSKSVGPALKCNLFGFDLIYISI